MNAKFEKWFKDNSWKLSSHGEDQFSDADLVWTCAIQSLEVTDELAELALIHYYGGDADQRNMPNMYTALNAVISALKEQAK